MSINEIILLISSGLIVGFINTLAGGGTIVSLSVLMIGMGLPADIANGTNRIAVTIQNMVAVQAFRKQKILDLKRGFRLAVPTVLGAILGAFIAVDIHTNFLEKAIALVMIVMLVFIIKNPVKWLKGQEDLLNKKISFRVLLMFFVIGAYGGFIHVGVGYFLLGAIVLGAGFDLVKGNAIKNFIVLCYTPVTLVVFMLDGSVNYQFGLVHAIGNVLGAYIGSKYAIRKGPHLIRWVMICVIVLSCSDLLGLINIKAAIAMLIQP